MLKHLFISVTISLSAILSASAISIGEIGFFGDVNNNANWSHFITLASDDEADSGEEQTLNISVTSLPAGGANYRVLKTVANGQFDAGNPKALIIGSNPISVPAVSFSRVVKIQFSSGDIEYDSLTLNGVALSLDTSIASVSLSEAIWFADSDNNDWPKFSTLTVSAQGSRSQSEQTLEMYVTSLPGEIWGGANLRVYKTTANGGDFFGDPQRIKLGPNTVTVPSVSFDRTVKIQFSSPYVDFNELIVNGSLLYPPLVTVESSGLVSLLKNSLGYYVDSESLPITNNGNQMNDMPGWLHLGVEASTNPSYAYDVLLRNDATDERALWSLDASGAIVASEFITLDQLRSYENAFAQDLDGDGQIDGSVTDTLPPVITLNGDSSITLIVGDTYEELGASATDDTDGTVEVTISGEVNTSSIGTYTITYTATDAAGNPASVTRTVTVGEADSDGDGVADSIDVHPGFDDGKLIPYLSTWLTENSYVSTSAIADFRAGSTSVAVSDGIAIIDLEMEQSNDLEAWTRTGESATLNVTVSEDTRFYRIKLAE